MGDLTELRRDVAQANRILERHGLSNAFGHVSARIPGTDTFLLPTRRSPAFASEDALLIVDTDGKVVSGDGQPNSELWIRAPTRRGPNSAASCTRIRPHVSA